MYALLLGGHKLVNLKQVWNIKQLLNDGKLKCEDYTVNREEKTKNLGKFSGRGELQARSRMK